MNELNPDPYAPTAWKSKKLKEAEDYFDFTTNGGQRCLLKPLDLGAILKLGLMDDLDYFGKMIGADPQEGKLEETKSDVMKAMGDPEKFKRLDGIMSKVVIECVVKPKIFPSRTVPAPDAISIDDIDFTEKMEIFGEVFQGLGENELGDFREESSESVGAVVTVESPQLSAEPDDWAVGDKSD